LASAAEMQRLILPNPLPKARGLSLAAHYETSRHVGGDYYDVVRISDDEFGILIADVSGHGAPSAIIMAMIRAVFHSFTGSPSNPSEVLQYINRHFRFIWGSPILATALYGIVNLRTLRLRMSCCGHLPALLLREGKVRKLDCAGTVPLLLMDMQSVPCDEFALQAGDRVLFYTDGVTEAEDASENMYEVGRLMAALQSGQGLSPQELVRSLAKDLLKFTAGKELTDDQTLLLMSMDPH